MAVESVVSWGGLVFDTIGVYVPITEHLFETLKGLSVITRRTDCQSGEVVFEYSNFDFHPSHGYTVLMQMKNEAWIYDTEHKRPVLSSCRPYLRFEFSIPKVLFGHNLISTNLILEACAKVKDAFENIYGKKLPYLESWFVYRLDTCCNFVMSGLDQVRNMIQHLQQLDYPRKPKQIHNGPSDAGLYFATRHNTLKVYSKGLEFKKHDAKRLRGQFTNAADFELMQIEADKILRVEVEHRRSLNYLAEKAELYGDFLGAYGLIDVIEKIDFEGEMRRIMRKILCGTMGNVVKSSDVYNVLVNALGSKSGNFYYSIYSRLVTHGQNAVKLSMKESTYYRALKTFRDLNISLVTTDLYKGSLVDRGFPQDFSLDVSENNKYYQLPLAA